MAIETKNTILDKKNNEKIKKETELKETTYINYYKKKILKF